VDKRTRDTLARMRAATDHLDRLLLELGRQGLQRLSQASLPELQAAAQLAHHARLTTLERELNSLQTLTERYLARDPLFSTDAWLDRLGRLSLRLDALRQRLDEGAVPEDLVDLVGAPRRTYTPLDAPITLHPIGMSGWVTDSDFVGVTATFHSPDVDGPVMLSVTRPVHYFGTDPARLAWQSVSDSITRSLRELAHGAWSVEGARISHDGRLSLAGEAFVVPAASTGSRALAPFACRDAIEVLDRIDTESADPLVTPSPPWVYLELAHYGPCVHDDTHATATVLARDARGLPVTLSVRMAPHERQLGRSMEQLSVPERRPDGLVGRAYASADALVLRPVTAVFHEPVVQRVGRRTLRSHLVHLSLEDLGRVERA
jgi:hypothetical protein